MIKTFVYLRRFKSQTTQSVPLASVPITGVSKLSSVELFGFPSSTPRSLPQHAQLLRVDGLSYFCTMLYNRLGERIAAEAFKRKLIRGFLHTSTGLEASCVGTVAALRPFQEDRVLTGYRNHSWAHAMGISWVEILSELFGRRTGCCSSKGILPSSVII